MTRKTLREWIKRADEGDERYVSARDAIEAAEAECEAQGVALIEAAAASGPEYWKAQAWLMEKRFPKRYGARAKLEHSGQIATGVMAQKSDEELWAILHPEAVKTASTDPDGDDD